LSSISDVPVKPPERVLLPEQDQQHRRQHDEADGAGELLAAAGGITAITKRKKLVMRLSGLSG
jgi:hypothetical protein